MKNPKKKKGLNGRRTKTSKHRNLVLIYPFSKKIIEFFSEVDEISSEFRKYFLKMLKNLEFSEFSSKMY